MDRRLKFACSVFGLVAAWAIVLWIVSEVVLAVASVSSAPLNEEVLAILADPDVERLVTIYVRFLERLMGTMGASLALLVTLFSAIFWRSGTLLAQQFRKC